MKTHAASRRLLSFALTLTLVFCLVPAAGPPSLADGAQAPVISTEPTEESTYAQNAAARFYVRASSPDKNAAGTGWLTYQWYASAVFDSKQDRDAVAGTPLANVDTIGNSAMSSALTITTPAIALPGTHYVYYWVEITNHFYGATGMIKSTVAEAKIVDRALKPEIQNGDFTNYKTPYVSDHLPEEGFWNTTHDGSVPDTISGYKPSTSLKKILEIGGAPSPYGIHYGNTDPAGNATGNLKTCELSSYAPSSIYQEIATVPGKIYEWSLDHGARTTGGTNPQLCAVVIGPAINEEADYTDRSIANNRWIDDAAAAPDYVYPYGKNYTTFFYDVVSQLAVDLQGAGKDARNLTSHVASGVGAAYTTVYGGSTYYVYISSVPTDKYFKHRSGAYTVPDGQGTTVFGFVPVTTDNGLGNILDNIKFASGSDLAPSQDVAYTGETSISAPVKEGYAYALAEVRGSSVMNLAGLSAWHDGESISASGALGGEGMWYTGMAGGEISFRDLTPGKTYRVIGIPAGAINLGLHTNLYPNEVFDDGYYRDVRMMPANVVEEDDSDSYIPSAAAGVATSGSAFITAENTRGDTQYALLKGGDSPDTSSSGAVAGWRVSDGDPGGAVADWIPGGGALQFDNLERGKEYYLVSRPYGYSEIDYEAAAYNADGSLAAHVLTTPAPAVTDLTAAQITRTRDAGGSDTIAIDASTTQGGYTCAVADTATGDIIGTRAAPAGGGTITFAGLDPGAVYQAVTKRYEIDSYMKGVRVFACAEELAADYQHNRLGLAEDSEAGDRFVPAGTEYALRATGGAYLLGSDAAWLRGSGSGYINLADGSLDVGGTDGASLFDALDTAGAAFGEAVFRRADSGSVGAAVDPARALAVPARPAAPSKASGDYGIDYVTEPEKLDAIKAVEYRMGAAGAWTPLEAGGSVALAALGWTGAPAGVHLRSPATEDAFASAATAQAIAGRPAPPSGISVTVVEGESITFSGLDDQSAYQYRKHGAGAWLSVTPGSVSLAITTEITADYDIRFAATQDAPASRAVTVSSPISMAPVVFGAVYGQAPAPAPLTLTNHMTTSVTGITLEIKYDDPYADYFTLSDAGPIAVNGSADSSAVTVSPKGTLDVGTYTAEIEASYSLDGASTTKTAVADLQFSVAKADWDMSGLIGGTGNVTLSGLTAVGFTAEITGGAPSGAALSWQAGDMAAEAGGEKVGADGKAQMAFAGLAPRTAYPLRVVALGDGNHYESAPVSLITAYTAMPAPATASAVRIDYGEERLAFNVGYSAADYIVMINDVEAAAVDGRIDVSAYADGTGSFAVSVTRKAAASADGQGTHPASAPSGFSVSCRAAAPAAHPHPATTELAKDGSITFDLANVQYRKAGSGDGGWQSAGQNAPAVGLGVGLYEVRIPPAEAAFASHIAEGIYIGASSQIVRVAGVAQVGGSDGTAATTGLLIRLDRPVTGFAGLTGAVAVSGAAMSGAISASGSAVSGGHRDWIVPINQIAVPNGGSVTLTVATGSAWQSDDKATSYVIEATDAGANPTNAFAATVYAPVPFDRPDARIDY
ncbi:MAG: hypothetical protein LBS32_04050, partial [Clostridiales Family XIII bacterium]|nr:hypothetical protein [Clostridiales Family XIII bacterium]